MKCGYSKLTKDERQTNKTKDVANCNNLYVASNYLLCNLNETTQLIPFLYLNWSFSPLKTFEQLSVEEENVRFERAIRTNYVVVFLTSICNIAFSKKLS